MGGWFYSLFSRLSVVAKPGCVSAGETTRPASCLGKRKPAALPDAAKSELTTANREPSGEWGVGSGESFSYFVVAHVVHPIRKVKHYFSKIIETPQGTGFKLRKAFMFGDELDNPNGYRELLGFCVNGWD